MSTTPPPIPPTAAPATERAATAGPVVRERDRGGWLGALAAWVAIAGCVFLILAGARAVQAPATPGATPPAAAAAKPDTLPPAGLLSAMGKAVVTSQDPTERKSRLAMLGMFRQHPADDLRVAILEAEVRGRSAALAYLVEVRRTAPPGTRLAQDAALLESLYTSGAQALTPEEAAGLAARHGWLGRLALTVDAAATDPARAAVLREAERTRNVMLALNFGVLGYILAGVGACLLMVFLLATGKVRRTFPRQGLGGQGGSVFVETFAVFMVGFLLLSVAAELLEPTLGAWSQLLRWGALGAAAWPLLRGTSWTRIRWALGWHPGRGVLREIGAGVFGYLAALPLLGIGILITVLLVYAQAGGGGEGSRLPTHPLGEMLAGASILELLLLVQLAVVWAPVVEETFFRGALFFHLRGRLAWPLAGLAQGFIFAVIHPQGWAAVPLLTMMGTFFAALREWRGSLIAPVVAHAMNNGTITLLLIVVLKV